MKTTESFFPGLALRPFLSKAASAGVVSGCGIGSGHALSS